MEPPDNPDTIQLDPEKVLDALKRSKGNFLGRSQDYWASVIWPHAQDIADCANLTEYDDWFLEELGYD